MPSLRQLISMHGLTASDIASMTDLVPGPTSNFYATGPRKVITKFGPNNNNSEMFMDLARRLTTVLCLCDTMQL